MKLDRLWQTLVYFDVIPFLGCIQRMFGKDEKIKQNQVKKMTDRVLIYHLEPNLINSLVKNLFAQNYQVKILTEDSSQIESVLTKSLAEKVEIITLTRETNLDSLKSQILTRLKTIVCPNKPELNDFILWVQRHLKAGEQLLFDFTQSSEEIKDLWGAVDDVVMGGISESSLKLAPNRAIFTGVVSTENNGGFASIRTKNFNSPWDLSAYEGIQLRVQGDGKRYKFITRCEGKWDGIGYCYSFDTLSNCWTTINIPFVDLIPVFRAKTVYDAGKFDPSKVYSMQLMLSKFEYDGQYNSKFQPGFFALEVESIKSYGAKKVPQLILISSDHS